MSLPRGIGLSWRPETAWLVARRPGLALTEVVAENVIAHGAIPRPLRDLRARGMTIVAHGISLSLGGSEPPDKKRLAALARLCDALRAPLVSEHVAFVRERRVEVGHLTPIARTEQMLEILIENVRAAQRALPVPLALENIASVFEWPSSEMTEPMFLAQLVRETGVHLLLDLANLHASAVNHGIDPVAYLDALPLDRVAYVHVAGGTSRDGVYHDTHSHPIVPGVLALVAALSARGCAAPLLLERDDHFVCLDTIDRELDAIDAASQTPIERRPVAGPTHAPVARPPRDRSGIAGSHLELARALAGDAPPPPGFDPERVAIARAALGEKKRRESARRREASSR